MGFKTAVAFLFVNIILVTIENSARQLTADKRIIETGWQISGG